MWECPNEKCDYTEFTKLGAKQLAKRLDNSKEGRTYIWSCGTRYGKCSKSKLKLEICRDCHAEECKKWYNLGRKDERKKWRKLYGRGKTKGNGTGHNKK